MRILFFTWRWPLRRFIGLVTELDRRGHKVIVVYPHGRRRRLPSKLRRLPTIGQEFYDEVSNEAYGRAISLLRHTRDYAWYLTPKQEIASFNRRRALNSLVGIASAGTFSADPEWPDPVVPAGTVDAAVVDDALAELERRIPADPGVVDFIRAQNPDVVLVSPLVHQRSHQNEVLKAARELGVPSGFLVYSWDNLSNKGRVHVPPDRTFVWNELQRREAVELQGVDSASVVVTGSAHWDTFFARGPNQSRDEFCEGYGFDPARPIVLYLGSTASVCRNEPLVVEPWLDALREASGQVASANILIRWHPSQKDSLSRWLPNRDGVSLSANPRLAGQDLYEELYHADAVVGLNTSAAIEAAIVGRPVYTFSAGDLAPGQEGTLHFYYLLKDNGGVVSYAETLEEHAAQVESGLRDQVDADAMRAFCEFFVRPNGVDRPVTPILIEAIEELGQRPADTPAAPAANASTAPISPTRTWS